MSKELSKFIDPLAIITIIACFLYYIGWAYVWGYFTRLGIQYQSLNLPASFYLYKAFWGFGAIFAFVSVLLVVASSFTKKDFKELLNRYLPTFTDKMLNIFIFLVICFLISTYLGEYHAKNLVEGDTDQLFIINFSWKENSPKEIEGKELMLIIHQEGKYFVVSKQKPAPEYPEVYIIPDDQIKFAVMKKSPFSVSSYLFGFAKNDA